MKTFFETMVKILHSIIWWVVWSVILLFGIVSNTILWPNNRKIYRKLERFWAWALMKVGGIQLDISGQENLPENETVVYMANHQSNLDWPIIFRTVPGQYLFVAKKELFDVFVFGYYMKQQGYIPISRQKIHSSLKTYQDIIEFLKKGTSIVIFPEGTRSYDERLQRFKSFSFLFLQKAKVRVVPIVIDGSAAVSKKGTKTIKPGRITVDILPPVNFDDLYSLDPKEFSAKSSERVRNAMAASLEKTDLAPIKSIAS